MSEAGTPGTPRSRQIEIAPLTVDEGVLTIQYLLP